MKKAVFIPSYWRRKKEEGIKEEDIFYDHPTPLDEEGTILRTVDSMNILNDKDFLLVVVAVANCSEIESDVERKVKDIVSKTALKDVPIYFFSHSCLKDMSSAFKETSVLSLKGYLNVRNVCLFLAHLLSSEICIFIDDDEVFEDPYFMEKASEFIGKDEIYAIAGYYIQEDGSWKLKRKKEKWETYWDIYERMNQAFEITIGRGPRLKETTFVFGGNMILHRKLFEKIPFDPYINRGEDIDYLIGAKMFGYKFYLDNLLSIKHLPPEKPYPVWRIIREDICRFVYEREKIRSQRKIKGMHYVKPEELDPYPGAFLKDDLEEKVLKTSLLLAEYYRKKGMERDEKEALRNIEFLKMKKEEDPFMHFLKVKEEWEDLIKRTECMKERLKRYLLRIK